MNWSEKRKLSDNQKKWLCRMIQGVFCLSFAVFAVIMCAVQGGSILKIYLPTSPVNDELFYYKQVEAIIHNGIPRGYYGYNESHAAVGGFGYWNPLIYAPYALFGKIAGWNFLTPIVFHLLLMCGSMFLLARARFLHPAQMVVVLVAYANMPILTRYMMMTMAEVLFFVVAILLILLIRSYWIKESNLTWIAFMTILCYITALRPYYIMLFVIPLYIAFKRKKKRILAGVLPVASAFIYWLSQKFCAPYFDNLNNAFLAGFQDGIVPGIAGVAAEFWTGFKKVAHSVVECFSDGNEGGRNWLVFLSLWLLMFILFLWKIKEKQKCEILLFGYINVVCVAVMAAIILLYTAGNPNAGSKHLLALSFSMIILIAAQKYKSISVIMCCFLLFFNIMIPRDAFYYELPFRTEEDAARKAEWEKVFRDAMIQEKEIGWENTVAWYVDAEWEVLYYVPPGFGINCCQSNVDVRKLRSRYILISRDNKNYEIAEHEGYTLIAEDDNWGFFRNGGSYE